MSDDPSLRRFRFSLLNLLLLLTALSSGASGYLLYRDNKLLHQENAQVRDQNRQLRMRYGEFNVEDPTKVYAVELRDRYPVAGNPWWWRWRVFLPEGKTHQLLLYNGVIPETGTPRPAGQQPARALPMRSGENYVSYAVYHDGANWREALAVNGSGHDGPFRNQPWMTWHDGRASPGRTLSWRHSQLTQHDAGYELYRFRAYQIDEPPAGTSTLPKPPNTAAPGFLLWIDSK